MIWYWQFFVCLQSSWKWFWQFWNKTMMLSYVYIYITYILKYTFVCGWVLFELSAILPFKTLSNLDEEKNPCEELQRDFNSGIFVFETLKDYHQNNTMLLKKGSTWLGPLSTWIKPWSSKWRDRPPCTLSPSFI